jgi:putative CocE/NonD family hydrolase
MSKPGVAGTFFLLLISFFGCTQSNKDDVAFIRLNFNKREVYITMRDGKKLFTVLYEPGDSLKSYPILMERTPYSCSPYGANKFPSRIGPNTNLMKEQYIFVYQDVRGRYKSEGNFQEMTPAVDNKRSVNDVDESSDTYDTIDWLLKNTKNTGRVGLWGISYPGFYASASLPSAHPAIRAVSPQAPVTDEFIGDDCNHNGAFFLLDNFGFYNYFDGERSKDSTSYKNVFNIKIDDAYNFFLQLGPVKNSFDKKYYDNKGIIWNQVLAHDTYDSFWKSRNIRPHLKNIKAAVLIVGGWFDAEDLFGALRTYEAIEKQNPSNNNRLVMGPWTHGSWAGSNWSKFGSYDFGQNTSQFYKDEIETKFFNYYLRDKGSFDQPEALVFETGTNKWKKYDRWPPSNVIKQPWYLQADSSLSTRAPTTKNSYDEYVSDPANPVPYTNGRFAGRNNEYLVEDQRFTAKHPDVVFFESDTLKEDVTVTGQILANLYVSLTGSDADFIVKVIDVLPDYESNPDPNPRNFMMAGFQRLVRAEVFRGKFRDSYEIPKPFTPGKIEKVSFALNEVAHTFRKGHRIMVQIQSSWFPIVDRNPQKFMSIPKADAKDFQKASIRIYHDGSHASNVILPVITRIKTNYTKPEKR